jgi:hypothetical protein
MQPTADRLLFADRTGLSGQYHKGSLKSVLDVVRLTQESPANAEDHRPMTIHQGGERRLIALEAEAFEELMIAARLTHQHIQPAA